MAPDLPERLDALYRRLDNFPEGGRCEHGIHLKPDAFTAFLDLRKLIEKEVRPALDQLKAAQGMVLPERLAVGGPMVGMGELGEDS